MIISEEGVYIPEDRIVFRVKSTAYTFNWFILLLSFLLGYIIIRK